MIRLNPDELVVSSFDTVDPAAEPAVAATKIGCVFTLDPTACTQCFVCPPATADCG